MAAALEFDTFFDEIEATVAPTWNTVFGFASSAVYRVRRTGEEITLSARTVIETSRLYPADTDEAGAYDTMRTMIDLDIHRPALMDASGKPVTPAAGDTVTWTREGSERTVTVAKPFGLQCYERVGSQYIRIHCQ